MEVAGAGSFLPPPRRVLPRKQGVAVLSIYKRSCPNSWSQAKRAIVGVLKRQARVGDGLPTSLAELGNIFLGKKRSYIPAESDRTVLPWSQCLAWQRRPRGRTSQMLRRQGRAESGGSRWLYRHSRATSLPAPWGVHLRGARLSLVSRLPWPLTAGLCLSVVAATPLSLSRSVLALSCHSGSPFLSFIFRPRRGKKKNKSHENPALSSLFPLPRRHREEPAEQSGHRRRLLRLSNPRPGCSSGFCSSQEIVIHRACFFAKCNYPRPCVYG